ncbi:hypothetical protein AYO21_09565 [Fonsecaea monophora]|uniref:G-protein coupled receptors family 2 profile 2 domain-containing protein n=1 Tax=Fonsecaea monophora TaxID=254056 RepID=A0A177EXZ0_9EURO|nr:hypothetical protein AYO21_09565 [Fonsecaea monophora]KAH0848865.1 cAMP receptor-like protein [Fonsecaea pedrosoi]OAG36251.1 hypothetical protein AYO21_09565 [Fonsecaea monophora]
MAITASQDHALVATERVTSVFSVFGAAFIIATFLSDSKFRKPINRLVFYAAWGNLFANVATLIARSGIKLGVTSPLCQFQGFLIHWFLPADALWTFAMACNVYLSFFRQYDASQIRGLEWRYLGACYGVPFVPALVFLFVSSDGKGKVYGDAVLWCWVSTEWNALRIATFYGPVWLIILVTMFIYVKSEARADIPSNGYAMNQLPTSPVSPKTYEVTISSQVPHSHAPSQQRNLRSPRNTYHEDAPSTNVAQTNTNVVVERPPIRTLDANKATMSYCKTAMLFFLALLCTWVPSTVNRVYTLVWPDDSVFGLDFASGLVLPLQGFWNTIIYIVTSLPACQTLWEETRTNLFGPRAGRLDRTTPALALSKHNHRVLGSHDTRANITASKHGSKRVVNYGNEEGDMRQAMMSSGPTLAHAR